MSRRLVAIETTIACWVSCGILNDMTRAELDTSLKQAVATGTPVEIVDPTTNEVYYLVSAAQFRGLSAALSDGFDPRDAYPLVDLVMADDDAQDPLLESYQ